MFPRIAYSLCSLMFAGLCTACTTISEPAPPTPQKYEALTADKNIDPAIVENCIVSAANRYYLPTKVIKALASKNAADGTRQLLLKVDVRDAVCIITSSGDVRSIIDTTSTNVEHTTS